MDMRSLVGGVAFALGLSMSAPALADAPKKEAPAKAEKAKAGPHDAANIKKHLAEHQTFPATKAQLVESCHHLKDFSDEDKKWFSDTLPNGNYKSADEVVKALGL